MQALALRRALAAVALVLAVSAPSRADDNAQIEKAKDILHDAEQWISIGCSDKSNSELSKAEKELVGVDETGKADTVKRIAECREKIAHHQKTFSADDFKKRCEREISGAEDAGLRDKDNTMRFERAQAQLDDQWNKTHMDAATLTELQKKLDWAKKKVDQAHNSKEQEATTKWLGRSFEGLDDCVKSAKTTTDSDYLIKNFANQIKEIEKIMAEHQKPLGAEAIADYKKKIVALQAEFTKNLGDAQLADFERIQNQIQEVLDGKNTSAYSNNVEDWFKRANERLATCPKGDHRTTEATAKLAEQRKKWDVMVAQGARDETVKPIVEYWKSCKEQYMKECEGWEKETTPTTLSDYLHHSPAKIGCDKTEKLLGEVVQRFYGNDHIPEAARKYPNDPELKATLTEASALREKASAKIISFVTAILDEAEKLPENEDRKNMQSQFYNMKVHLTNAAKGSSGIDKVTARIDELDKKWAGQTAAGEAAKVALDKKVCDAVKEAWPGLAKPWLDKVKRLDAAEAVANIGAWKGTVVHFSGGSRGVNMNRAGWDYFDPYAFVTEVNGVPVAGDLDSGVYDAIREIEKQTTIGEDNCEEAIGVVDGTCKVTQRVKIFDQYVKGEVLTAVKIRIVGWRACTVCAVAGEGTNLSKLKEYKEVSVKEQGVVTGGSMGGQGGSRSGGGSSSSSSSGGFGHMIHRFMAWGMCALLALAGALAAAHGAAKFVPALHENLAKLGSKLGYAGVGFAVVGVLWFLAAMVFWVIEGQGGSLPSIAMILAGAFVGLDLLREKGTLKPETASMIQPAGILLGLMCFGGAFIHFLLWDWTLL